MVGTGHRDPRYISRRHVTRMTRIKCRHLRKTYSHGPDAFRTRPPYTSCFSYLKSWVPVSHEEELPVLTSLGSSGKTCASPQISKTTTAGVHGIHVLAEGPGVA